jgi:hypothetical protein
MPSLDGSDRAAPPSLDRSDCSSIGDGGDFDAFTPRSECCIYEDVEEPGAGGDGDDTPRVVGPPHFTLQPYLKSYMLHSQIKATLLSKGDARRDARAPMRPVSAPSFASGQRGQHDTIVINGIRYVPAGPAPCEADVLRSRKSSDHVPRLKLSRTFTDFSSPSKGPLELESPERRQNKIRTRPWTAQARTSQWKDGENTIGSSQETRGGTILRAQSAEVLRPPPDSLRQQASANSVWSHAEGPEHARPANRDSPLAQETEVSMSPSACTRKRPSSAGFIQPFASGSHDRRRPSSAHPASGGRPKHLDELSHRVGGYFELDSMKRPSSAGFVQPSAGVSIFRPQEHGRPASANRIRFQGDGSHEGASRPVPDTLNVATGQLAARGWGSRPPSGASMRPSSAASHFSSRPSSASAQRQLQQETESVTSYSQDPIHPERLQVTYVTRKKQSEDSRMNIQYDGVFNDDGEGGVEEEAWGVLSQPRPVALTRPSSALSRPISTSGTLDAGAGPWRTRPGTAHSAIAQSSTEEVRKWPNGDHKSLLPGSGREASSMPPERVDAVRRWRPRPSTAPGPSSAPRKRQEPPWQHRMERIWEKRFSYLGEGNLSQDSADSSRGSESSGNRDHGDPQQRRQRPRSASGVLVSGAGEVRQLRRQMRVIEDVQRDLDLRMTSECTGIADDDDWLIRAQHRSRPSSACVVQ